MRDWLWLIPALPFAGFLVLALAGFRMPRRAIATVAVAAVALAALVAIVVAAWFIAAPPTGHAWTQTVWHWFAVSGFAPTIGFRLDALALVMVVVVAVVALLIHVYASASMDKEEGYARFFAYMNLFVASMLTLLLADNLLLLYLGWEGVGLCSYLLIGFWYEDEANGRAAQKAFIVTRIGDVALAVAILLLFTRLGTLDLAQIGVLAPQTWTRGDGAALAAAFLLLGGAVGKSAQLPLQTWLPDAMAGPTPVSALIHAATMVTAGVYMVVRSNALYRLAPGAMMVVALIGALTALFAATIGIRQWDIKKVLAYSTVSQLGFMFIGVGVGAFTAGVFHLVTHAFFKACLFLGSGSVIHAMSGEQDMRKMGGLKSKIPITYWTFLIATIAIAGIPPLAGFFSKDEILASALANPYFPQWFNAVIWTLGTLAAFCTAFYMFRLVYLTFFGSFRGTHDQEHHLHESPWTMTLPLIVLATLSAVGGAILGWPHRHFLAAWLHPIFPEIAGAPEVQYEISPNLEYGLMFVSTAIAVLGIWTAYSRFYKRGLAADEQFAQKMPAVANGMENKWYVDELYGATIVRPLEGFSRFLWRGIDALIDGLLALLGYVVAAIGDLLRFFQTGNVRNYALMFFLGVIVFVWVLA